MAADGAYLIPAMAIIATAMVTATLSPGFDRYYPARVVTATVALLFYRRSYSEMRFTWSWDAFLIGCGGLRDLDRFGTFQHQSVESHAAPLLVSAH